MSDLWTLTFKAEAGSPRQSPAGHVGRAFAEFFEAKNRQIARQSSEVIRAEEAGEVWPNPEPELGDGCENAFEASNGIKIWFEDEQD